MAEQKSEDTKPSLARRGARPFAGPAAAGGPAGTPGAARPFVRPATPGHRPAPAPFAPRAVPGRPNSLGGPVAPAPLPAPTTPTSLDVASAPTVPSGALSADATTPAHSTPELSAAQPIEAAAQSVVIEPATPTDVTPSSPRARAITSEMVALDAIDAFDALWATAADAAMPTDSATVADRTTAATPLDESSLGMLDAPSLWAEEIAGDAEHTPAPVLPTVPDATASHNAALEMPAWLADDHDATPSGGDPTVVVESTLPNVVDASAADVPAAQNLTPGASIEQPAQVRFELVEDTTADERAAADIGSSAMVFPGNPHVSAALDRLAQRVRSGEIDVSSIAPEATDAAMLAFVLAALLGGSSSR